MISFFVPGLPKSAGSKRAFVVQKAGQKPRAIITDSVDTKGAGGSWRADVRAAAQQAMDDQPPFEGALALAIDFHMPRPKGHYGSGRNAAILKPSAPAYPTTMPDLTKMLRAVEDALKGICWRDDAQVVTQACAKYYAEEGRVGAAVSIGTMDLDDVALIPRLGTPQLTLVDGGAA
jgi:Holliday junction resolvase RusA-like endonuclease